MIVSDAQVGRLQSTLEKSAMRYMSEIEKMGSSMEDFVQDVMLNILTRSNQVLDESKAISLESFGHSVAKRHLIDLRKRHNANFRTDDAGVPFRFLSLNSPIVSNTTSDMDLVLEEVIPGNDNMADMILLAEMIESVPTTQISSNYEFTWRELMEASMEFSALEISEMLGVCKARVLQLQKNLIKQYFQAA